LAVIASYDDFGFVDDNDRTEGPKFREITPQISIDISVTLEESGEQGVQTHARAVCLKYQPLLGEEDVFFPARIELHYELEQTQSRYNEILHDILAFPFIQFISSDAFMKSRHSPLAQDPKVK